MRRCYRTGSASPARRRWAGSSSPCRCSGPDPAPGPCKVGDGGRYLLSGGDPPVARDAGRPEQENAMSATASALPNCREALLADLTDAALVVASRYGVSGSSVDQELTFWKSLSR